MPYISYRSVLPIIYVIVYDANRFFFRTYKPTFLEDMFYELAGLPSVDHLALAYGFYGDILYILQAEFYFTRFSPNNQTQILSTKSVFQSTIFSRNSTNLARATQFLVPIGPVTVLFSGTSLIANVDLWWDFCSFTLEHREPEL